METLLINSSLQTPYINFDKESGVMQIKGRSIPDQPDEFWGPILTWFDSYILSPSKKNYSNH